VPAFLIGAMLVGGTEVAQIFIRSHAADATDGLFGCLGVAIGIAAARRLFLHRHLEGRSADALATKAIAALLAWCLVLMAYHWQPFDFRVDADAVRSKAAAFSLIPFAGYQSGSDLNALNTLLTKTGLAVPAGFVSAFALRRALPASLLTPVVAVGAALVFGTLEAGQFFLPARYPDATDVLIGVAGAWLGLRVARWLSAASSQEP
ncbi:MAG: VanZ family protein, partial [Acidobacteriota bacterium]